jgi:hypothetical protein
MGRFPDGASPPSFLMSRPSPGQPNIVTGANQPPRLIAIGNRTVNEASLLTFTATATDADSGQSLTFSLSPDAPEGASVDSSTGVFRWTPTEAQGPGVFRFAVQVTDSGTPPLTAAERITVTVAEVNQPPALAPISNQSVFEGSLLALNLAAVDSDLPANPLTFSLPQGGPAGMALDPLTGALTWTPAENQAPGQYTITVRVTDSGSPSLSDEKSFLVTANEVNNPPAIEPVLPQTVQELSQLTYTIKATDPDASASPIVYSFDTAPTGATIHPSTGAITWTPTEAQGPANAVFLVRATESSPPNLSSAVTFSVAVTEKNESPALAPLASLTAVEGQPVVFAAQGTDPDLPPQTLTYSLMAGAPAGASVDPVTGWFSWTIDPDFGASTNLVTVQVADDGPGNLTATRTFAITVVPQWHAVISEIMHRPSVTNAEFIELVNNSARTTVDLTGTRLVGSNLLYNFAAGTTLLPGARLLVVRNPAAFAAAYPGAGPVAGQYTGTLGGAGDTLRVVRPGPTAGMDVVLDEVSYGSQSPWAAAANGGSASLQLIDDRQDNNRVGNWQAVPTNGLPTTPQWQQVTMTGVYAGANPLLYVYLQGPGSVSLDDFQLVVGNTPGVGQNLLQNGGFESPLAIGWNTTANTASSAITAEVKRSGNAALRLVCGAGGTTQGNSLWQNVAGLANGTTYTLSYWYLPQTNGGTLTVRFSGYWVTSDQNLGFTPPVAVTQFTPGASNNVAATLPPFPSLRLNEVQTRNLAGLIDLGGKREPWIELVNTGFEDVSLDGLYLTTNYANLTNWAFPSGWTIPAGGFLVVFADGEPSQTTAQELHTSFRLPTTQNLPWSIALSGLANSKPLIADYLNGWVGPDDTSFGRARDGEPAISGVLTPATPGASNQLAPPPQFVSVGLNAQGQPLFTWKTTPGILYLVEYKNALGAVSWTALGSVQATGDTTAFTDTTAGSVTQRFYRVSRP